MVFNKKYLIAAGVGLILLLLPRKSAAAGLSKDCNKPRGIRNNNPGNIRVSGSAWKGKIPYELNQDYDCTANRVVKSFEQFETYEYGVRAIIVLVTNYINRDGLNTIAAIINKWAPSNENNTSAYANRLSLLSGIPINQQVTATKETLRKLVKGIGEIENGLACISNAQFEAAWALI